MSDLKKDHRQQEDRSRDARSQFEGSRVIQRLGELADQIARQLERLNEHNPSPATGFGGGISAFSFSERQEASGALSDDAPLDHGDHLVRVTRPPLPDPRLVRRIIRQRKLRARYFDERLFADPAWDMLLDLTAARAEHSLVSVTSLCIASGVPLTTALRWISQMTEAGLLERLQDEADRRRVFITLTDKAFNAMARYFAELGTSPAQLS